MTTHIKARNRGLKVKTNVKAGSLHPNHNQAVLSVTEAVPVKPAPVRRARTVLLVIEGDGLVMFNYLNNACEDCSPLTLRLLTAADDWVEQASVLALTEPEQRATAELEYARLVALGFLVTAGTEAARRDETFENDWAWDIRAGLFNLAIKDPPFHTTDEQLDDLEVRIEEKPKVELYSTNERYESVVELPKPKLDEGVFPFLKNRRTYRTFDARPLPIEWLHDCLFAGLGITGFEPEPVKGMGRLPLKMTPSGGARNPFEAYVLAANVEGVPPGFYHYSALEGTLGLVAGTPLPKPSDLLCGQDWWDGGAAVVFLVANFRRTMWKYEHPMAYRAVMIEAGHIGQNVMLAATHHGMTAGPTALLRDSLLEEILGLDRIMQSVVYALVLGIPSAEKGRNPREAVRRLMQS